jgi:hypothetical protein
VDRSPKTSTVSFAGATALVALLLALLAFAGCGTGSYANKPKPPITMTISVFVGENEIAFAPKKFGAGPVRFIITNQTGANQKITISTDRDAQTLTIVPHQTAEREMVLQPGNLSLDADKTTANPVQVTVGPERPSAQQELDQP